MKKLITFLMLLTLFGVSSVWADNTYEWSADEQKTTLSPTVTDTNTDGVQYYTGYSLTYGGTTYTKAVKIKKYNNHYG